MAMESVMAMLDETPFRPDVRFEACIFRPFTDVSASHQLSIIQAFFSHICDIFGR